MKNKTNSNSTIFRNNYIIKGVNNRSYYGCEITHKDGGETHTILWVTTDKVAQMGSEEFKDMLTRHGVA